MQRSYFGVSFVISLLKAEVVIWADLAHPWLAVEGNYTLEQTINLHVSIHNPHPPTHPPTCTLVLNHNRSVFLFCNSLFPLGCGREIHSYIFIFCVFRLKSSFCTRTNLRLHTHPWPHAYTHLLARKWIKCGVAWGLFHNSTYINMIIYMYRYCIIFIEAHIEVRLSVVHSQHEVYIHPETALLENLCSSAPPMSSPLLLSLCNPVAPTLLLYCSSCSQRVPSANNFVKAP